MPPVATPNNANAYVSGMQSEDVSDYATADYRSAPPVKEAQVSRAMIKR
jgi:hypothetical protein